MDLLYPVLSIIGGLLCATGDLLLDLKGKDNQTLDDGKMINSSWITMKSRRFRASIILAMIGVPCTVIGAMALGELMAETQQFLGNLFRLSMFVGGIGGMFIHGFLCIVPILFQELVKITDTEKACDVVQVIWKAIALPFLLLYLFLVPVSSLAMMTFVVKGNLGLPVWCIAVNPLCFLLIGVLLRKIFPKYCYELPGICMPSLGLGAYGIIGLLLI